MAYGNIMSVDYKGTKVTLRPIRIEEMTWEMAEAMSSLETTQYLNTPHLGKTIEDERAWFEKNRTATNCVIWGIEVEGKLVGSTGIHDLDSTPKTGVVIWVDDLRGKGVGTSAHLMRTMHMADFLGLRRVATSVREDNVKSRRALERVGYTVCGEKPMSILVRGKWLTTLELVWFNPFVVAKSELKKKYHLGWARAKETILTGRELVVYRRE